MAEPDVFVLADRALARVVGQIAPDQWDVTLPASFATSRRREPPSLRSLINYHAYDDAWVPDMLAGLTMAEAGADKFDGDLLGDDPAASFEGMVAAACAAAQSVRDLDAVAHLSFGDYPVREYFWQINSFRALRAHDIARADRRRGRAARRAGPRCLGRGQPPRRGVARHGVYPAVVPVPEDAPLLAALARADRPPTRLARLSLLAASLPRCPRCLRWVRLAAPARRVVRA